MPTADTHHRCGEVHFCFRRAVGRRRCLLDFVTQTGYGEARSLLLFLVLGGILSGFTPLSRRHAPPSRLILKFECRQVHRVELTLSLKSGYATLVDSEERCIGRASSAARVAASFTSRCARTAANSPRRSTAGSLDGSIIAAASATHSPINAWYRSPRAPIPLTNHTFGRFVCARPANGTEPSGLRGGIARTPARTHTGEPAAARGGKSPTSPG